MLREKRRMMRMFTMFFTLNISTRSYAYAESGGISLLSYFGNLILFFIIFAAIVFLAIYTTKFIGKKTNYLGRGKNLTVLDYVNLSGNVKILTIKIYKKIYILSIANSHTTLIDKFDEEDLGIDLSHYLDQGLNSDGRDFNDYIDYFKEKMSRKIKDKPQDKE